MKLEGIKLVILLCCSSQYVIAHKLETKSFGCRCGISKRGAADEIRRKRQAVNSILDVFRKKRDTINQDITSSHLMHTKSTQTGLNDVHSRIVNGYEPQRRPWITLITILRSIYYI